MQRYFVSAKQFHNQQVTIEGDDAHHLLRVMRARVGDKIICSDGQSREVIAKIVRLLENHVIADIIEEFASPQKPKVEVWIAQSMPKSDKMEWLIQKGTELGASGFIPFVSARTIVQYDEKKEQKRTERWQKIAKEAAEQAHRSEVPIVKPIHRWQEILELASQFDRAWVCYEQEHQVYWRSAIRVALQTSDHSRFLVLIGPEGGFTEQEIEQAQAAHMQSVSLGKRILRTETVAMVILSSLAYECGEMGE